MRSSFKSNTKILRPRTACALLLAASFSTTARATNYLWNNGSYNVWNSSQWSPGGVPGSSDTATISSGLVTISQAAYASQLTLTSSQQAFVYVEGNGIYGDASLTAPTININGGFVSMTTIDAGYASSITASLGLTVASGAALYVDTGAGGARYIAGSLYNHGTVTINQPADLYNDAASNNLVNTGTFNIFATTGAHSLNIDQNAGTMQIDSGGSLTVAGGSFNYAGGSVVGTVDLIGGANLSTTVSSGNNIFRFLQSASLTSNLPSGLTLLIQGNGTVGDVEVTVPNQMNNHGTIRLESIDAAYGDSLSVAGSGTLNNYATISANSNFVGGPRVINGTINNVAGAHLNLNLGTTLNGSIANAGTVSLTSGTTTLNDGYFLNSAGGSLSLTGADTYFLLENGSFYYAGGTVSGQVEFRENGYLSISTNDGHGASFLFSRNGGQLPSNVPVNTSITVMGNGVAGDVTLDLPNTVTNAGTITLGAEDGAYFSTLRLAAGKTLTNNGTLNMTQGGVGGNHQLIGTFINNYALYDDGATTYLTGDFTNNNLYERQAGGTTYLPTGSTFRQNANQLYIDNGGTFYVNGGTFIFAGGTINVPITLASNPDLQTPTSDGKGASFNLISNGNLDTSLPVSTSLNIIANGTVGDINAIVRDGDSNSGAIYLNANDGAYQSGIAVYRASDNSYAGTYNNKGSIYSSNDFGTGGARAITGNIANTGYIYVKTSLDIFGTLDDKAGDVSITPGQTLTVHGADNHFILDGGLLDIEKNATLAFPDGGSYQFVSGKLSVAGTLVLPSHPGSLLAGDSITAAGTGSQVIIEHGGLRVAGGQLVSDNGGLLISQDGNSLISQDGNSLIGQDGNGVVSNDGGSFIARNGGGLISSRGTSAPAGLAVPGAIPLDDTDDANIVGDNSAIVLDNGYATADGNGILKNGGILFGNGTFTATAFDVDSSSYVTASGGTLHLIGAINPYSSGTLTTGHWRVQSNSSLDAPSIGPITTNQAFITFDGPGSLWTNADSLSTNQGSLTITHGRNFTTASSFTNSGSITIGPSSTFEVSAALTNTGTIDLAGGTLKLDQSNLPDILSQLHSAYDNGTWDGPGITSSLAAADPSHQTAITYSLTGTTYTLQLGLPGDANLDGKINADDYTLLDRGYAKHLTNWQNGDFNYDNTIDQNDYLLLDRSFLLSRAPGFNPGSLLSQRDAQFGDAYVSSLLASVPEPSSLFAACGLALPLLTRRRSTQKSVVDSMQA